MRSARSVTSGERLASHVLFNRARVNRCGIESLRDREPTPEFAAEFADLCGSMLDSLGDETLKQIAQMKLKNYDAVDIAKTLGVTRRTVERKLLIIRGRWERILPSLQDG